VFIDLLVAEIDLGPGGDDQRELHPFPARPPRLKKDALNAGKNQFAHRASVGGRLRFEPAVERCGDIDRGANAILLHKGYYPMCAINMEHSFLSPSGQEKRAREESELNLSERRDGN
jgi:hypothetical protein